MLNEALPAVENPELQKPQSSVSTLRALVTVSLSSAVLAGSASEAFSQQGTSPKDTEKAPQKRVVPITDLNYPQLIQAWERSLYGGDYPSDHTFLALVLHEPRSTQSVLDFIQNREATGLNIDVKYKCLGWLKGRVAASPAVADYLQKKLGTQQHDLAAMVLRSSGTNGAKAFLQAFLQRPTPTPSTKRESEEDAVLRRASDEAQMALASMAHSSKEGAIIHPTLVKVLAKQEPEVAPGSDRRAAYILAAAHQWDLLKASLDTPTVDPLVVLDGLNDALVEKGIGGMFFPLNRAKAKKVQENVASVISAVISKLPPEQRGSRWNVYHQVEQDWIREMQQIENLNPKKD